MTGPLTEKRHAGSFIVEEQNGFMSREEVTVSNLNGTEVMNLEAGQVLGKVGTADSNSLGANGEYVPADADAADGSATAVAILFGEVYLAAGEKKKVTVISRGPTDVRQADLTFGAADVNASITSLAASPRFIRMRPAENDDD